jgi:hypothetical protein
MTYTRKQIVQITAGVSWGLLGFKRGTDKYHYSYQNEKQVTPTKKKNTFIRQHSIMEY